MGLTERLNLRWNSFETNTRVNFKKLRYESEFSDVTLVCNGGRQVSAHKVILAGGSSFFQQILRQNPHPHPLVYLKGVKYEHLWALLDFVYTGEATIVQEDLKAFLEVAEDLQIKGLIEKDGSSKTSVKETQKILLNNSYQNTNSVVKEETGPQPEVLLLQRKASSSVNHRASQSPSQENQDYTPPSNIKIELTDTVHSDVSFGMDNREEMMDQEKKEMTTYRHDQSSELEFNDGYNMTESELVGSVSNNVEARYWYEKGGEDEEVSKATSMKHNTEQGQNRNDEVLYELISVNKKGSKVCTDCGKSFKYNSDLKRHTREHTGEKPFACMYCPKKFSLKSNLKQHTRIHTGEKPFQCLFCNNSFTTNRNMKMHKKKCTMKL